MAQGQCPPITLLGDVSVSGSLTMMDCHIDSAVRIGYDRLFGQGGALGYALTGLLTIYIGLLALGFMTGRTRLTLAMMSPRVVTMVLVLTFVSVWPAYHAVFYDLLMNGPDQIAAMILGQQGSAMHHFAETLDALFVRFATIAQALDADQKASGVIQSQSMPVTLFWLSGLLLLVSTLGVLILSRLTLYLLMIIGPVFILFGLFPQTRGLFNGWLRTSLIFSLAPMLTILGGTAALMLFIPLINSIASDPKGHVEAVQPMIMLFMGSLIYSAFLATLMWVSASLVRDWQAALRDKAPDPMPSSRDVAGPSTSAQPMMVPASPSSFSYDRTAPLVTAVTRDGDGGGGRDTTRIQTLGLYEPGAATSAASGRGRTEALGQRFRSRAPSQAPVSARPEAR